MRLPCHLHLDCMRAVCPYFGCSRSDRRRKTIITVLPGAALRRWMCNNNTLNNSNAIAGTIGTSLIIWDDWKFSSSLSAEYGAWVQPTYFSACETHWNELPLTRGAFSALFRCRSIRLAFLYCNIHLGKKFYFSTLDFAVTTNSLEIWALKRPFSTDMCDGQAKKKKEKEENQYRLRTSVVRNPAWPLYQ